MTLLKLIKADLRTPPTTTMSAILHTRSWHSRDVNFLPAATLNRSTVKLNRSAKGSGPEARPPKVFSLAPAGRTLVKSHLGTLPAYRRLISSLNAEAQPILLSDTTMVDSVT